MPKTTKDTRAFKVFTIKQGTAIDHITAGSALKIIRILNLAEHDKIVTVGLNFPSKRLGLKDIVKVENRELTPEEIARVAIFAPKATINIIRDFEVYKKFDAEIPEVIEYVVVCPNPKCITNNEQMSSKFHVLNEKNGLKLKCYYCERTFKQEEIKDYKTN